ncbi:receptor-interacting serine/threonine-protein kinase 4-like [Physella acuta]|uniref:receptor-interacting serine/threonine-protein kinase 4-like n=1 Tax=Physella acuta TaxID=109671 RepID=UPI0027DCE435|nr:receptor-interacting serine/threonine-protein kinase 4-like [Physella acuta]
MNPDDAKESSLAWPKDRCVECQLSTRTTPTNFELKQQLISRIRDNDSDYVKTTLSKFKKEERKQIADSPRILLDDLSTLLMHAVYHGRTEIIDYLIDDCGCDVSIKNIAGWTAMMFAALKGHIKIVETLINKGEDIDAVNSFESTALHIAADEGHEHVVRKLLDCGADPTYKDNACWTALEIAKYNGFHSIGTCSKTKCTEIVKYLMELKCDVHLKSHVNIFKQLLGHQARADIKDSAGLTAFQIAKTGDVCEEAKKVISKMITSNYMSSSFHPIAEMIDFAYEYKTSCLKIDTIDIKHKPCLEFVYDDIDLDYEDLSTMLLSKLRDILRCLGNDVLMFTKTKGSLAVTYLSPSYLMSTDGETLVAPRVEYGIPGHILL